jgi:crotonobetainyl-CoA:carnitine CoA-transferase CaiB-like acyl-CoA transferase
MTLLTDIDVIALDDALDSALARLLKSLGARVRGTTLDRFGDDLSTADVLLDRIGLPALARAGYERGLIESLNPRLVHVSVTAFGSIGPRASWQGSELVASAMGGTLRLTGEPDRPPVKEALDACWFHADMVAASGTTAALLERDASGKGQHVDVSVQEVAFSRNVNGVLVWQFDRRKLHRVGGALNYGKATVRCIWPLADGYCFHTLMTGRFGAPANQALSDWMDECGVPNPLRGVDWMTYNRSTLDSATRMLWEQAIEAFFRTRTRREIAEDGARRGINATVIAEPADVLRDPHLEARRFWDGPPGQREPGRFVAVTEGPQSSRGETTRPTSRPGPLSGIRVLDFSWALVGSITTKTLGDLGCEVIKVESRTRACLSRLDVQVNASRADSLDDKPWFAHLNTSKRSLALDLKSPESRSVLEPLLEWADVVVENFSPGTMAKLGLDYETLSQRYPRLIMVSGSVFGQTGPRAQSWGVDGTGAALSGRTFLTGWPDRDPVIPGAVPYGDVIVPFVMAAAVAAALARRRRTGRGYHIDASMYEICVQQMRSAILAAERGERPMRQGNLDAAFYHQGVYPALGDDTWIALSLRTEAQWRELCDIAGLSAACTPSNDEAVGEWTRLHEALPLVERLQQRGIAAGVVQDIEELMERDPQIAARHALVELDHPLLGPFGHVRTPITFSRSVPAPYRAPRMGEHSEAIAREIAQLSEARISELQSAGVFR